MGPRSNGRGHTVAGSFGKDEEMRREEMRRSDA
jgi:hypothetical protein